MGELYPVDQLAWAAGGQSSAQRSSKGQRDPHGWRGPKGLQEVLVTGAVGYPDRQRPGDHSSIGGSLEGKLLLKN